MSPIYMIFKIHEQLLKSYYQINYCININYTFFLMSQDFKYQQHLQPHNFPHSMHSESLI